MPTLTDEESGTPCIACGAPVLNGEGHDEGCPVAADEAMARAMDYDPSTFRDEDGPWGGGFARNH